MQLNRKFIGQSIIVLSILLLVVFIFIQPEKTIREDQTTKVDSVLALSLEDHYKWRAGSDITVISYYSIDCPYCRELYLAESKYKTLYENTFSLVYRPSPLPDLQPLSLEKAVIAECVFRQSGEDEMFLFLNDVFTNYSLTQENNDWVEKIANKYIKNQELFSMCRDGEGLKTVIKQSKQALADSVFGTPTIIVMKGNETIIRLEKPTVRTVFNTFNSIRKI